METQQKPQATSELPSKRARTTETESAKGRTEAQAQPTTLASAAASPLGQYATNPQFLSQLCHLRAEQLPLADRVIFICQRTDKVVDVWKGMIQHNFLSVPVLQKTKNKYYGFVDISDIVQFVVQHFGEQKLTGEGTDFWELVKQEESFQTKTVNDIMTYPLSRRNPFHPVTRGYSLFHVCELLARERGLHRVPIVGEDRQLVHMITQSRLIQFLCNNIQLLGNIRNKPVSALRSIEPELLTVLESDTALHAFQKMTENNVSGLAVVHADKKLMGSISLRDLKAIQSDARMFWRLSETVTNFLKKVRQEKDDRPHRVVSVHKDDTLETVLLRLNENHIHRVFVIDENKIPVAVISLKDVLHEIITSV